MRPVICDTCTARMNDSFGMCSSVSQRIRWYRLFYCSVLAVGLLTAGGCSRCNHTSETDPAASSSSMLSPEQLAIVGPIAPVLEHNSAECAICAINNCRPQIERCNTVPGNADAGPAIGKPRSQLCMETLDCLIKSRCVNTSTAMQCYCGTADGTECLGGKGNGSCRRKLDVGMETTNSNIVLTNFDDKQKGAGAAIDLTMCLIVKKCHMCL